MLRTHQPLKTPIEIESNLFQIKEDFLITAGRKKALELFHRAAIRVPAYKDFLKKQRIAPEKIVSYEDFQLVPPISKKNYINEYPLEMLCWDGTMQDKALTFAVTSGSTGKPTYFPRDEALDLESSIMHEVFLKNINGNHIPSTLVIVGFCMGIWIGGLITYQAFRKIALRHGYPISMIAPGLDKKEILAAIHNLHSKFDQIILCGYPPFIKDLLHEGTLEGIDWKNLNLKFIFAAEAFSQEYRDFIIKTVGAKNPYRVMTNIYGTVDLGTMAMETPLSIFVRDTAYNNAKVQQSIFPGVNRTPTLAQFNPLFVQFDTLDNNLLCTASHDLPFIRYDIGDHGGVFHYSQIVDTLKNYSIDVTNEAHRLEFDDTLLEWPFVYVYERSDFTTKLHGVIIYPEHIREAILNPSLESFLTGKFTMETKTDEENNQYLEINVELKSNIKEDSSIEKLTQQLIVKRFLEKNELYRYFAAASPPGHLDPKINFFTYGNELHFKAGTKHKWVRK